MQGHVWDIKRKIRELKIIICCFDEGLTATETALHLRSYRQYVEYYFHRLRDTTWHCGMVGGYKGRSIIKDNEIPIVQAFVIEFWRLNSHATFDECRWATMQFTSRYLCKSTFADFLQRMGWSSRVPVSFQIQKYTPDNLARYVQYLTWIQALPDLSIIKFADESHFTRKVYKGHRMWGMKNRKIYDTVEDLENTIGTLILFCGIDSMDEPIFVDYLENNNNQFTFAEALFKAISANFLKAGDILILDNASVHQGNDAWPFIQELLLVANVQIVFLPAYSPELNPCELIFGRIKSFIRAHHHSVSGMLFEHILAGIAQIGIDEVKAYFCHCVFPHFVLPDYRG